MPASSSPLHQLARHYGVAATFTDAENVSQTSSDQALVATLIALGAPIRGADDAAEALAQLATEPVDLCPPVVVAWQGRGRLAVADRVRGPFSLTIECEDGQQLRTFGHILDELSVELPRLPLGYHRGRLTVDAGVAELTIIAAPNRTYRGLGDRQWGVFAPLYSFGRKGGTGCGDLRDLGELCDIVGRAGGSFVGTLPLLDAFLDEPASISPYAPVSRLFWNPLYLDIEALPEWKSCSAARDLGVDALAALDAQPSSDHVDHAEIFKRLRPVFAAMAEHVFTSAGQRLQELLRHIELHPELEDYARFRAYRVGSAWTSWPSAARDGELEPSAVDTGEYRMHLYLQWCLHEQLAGLASKAEGERVSLYLDLPVGSHPHGYDAWRQRDSFVAGLSCGAPPDLLNASGQNWGFPPLHPQRLRQAGYRYVIDMIRNHCRYAGMLRIDHVMWLHRIYCVPEGFEATDGIYVHYRADELWAILCLESHRSQTIIIGEDLGTVPETVRAAMHRRGAAGMHLAQFELRNERHDAMVEPRVDAVASLGTHDTPMFAAFVEGSDVDLQVELGHLDADSAERVHRERAAVIDCLRHSLHDLELVSDSPTTAELVRGAQLALASTSARFVLIAAEDLWGELQPQNVPGTTDEVPNWSRRAQRPLSALETDPAIARLLAEIDARRRRQPEPLSLRARALQTPHVRADVTAMSEDDIYLFNEGRHLQCFDFLGAHPCIVDGVHGARFAVWAPNADAVSVIGSFNDWDRGRHPLSQRQSSGIWEGFVPGALTDDLYKYFIRSRLGSEHEKADPFAFRTEEPPKTASVVCDLDYRWNDDAWMGARAGHAGSDRPVSIYEVHLGSFMRVPEEGGRSLSYREVADRLVDHVGNLGFTHVELLPVMEHPFYGSWGYQSTAYFAPTARYGSPQDLMYLIDRLHQANIGVILDWVPSHFPNDPHGLACFDGTHLFEHADPRLGFHPDWQSCIFNYGRNEVRSFLISSALFWLHNYHVDGIRVDAVASMLYRDYSRQAGEWIPNEYGGNENLEAVAFLRQLNEAIYSRFPDVQTYAEESTAWPGVSKPTFAGGLGFGFKWDMGWMHDTLRYMMRDPIYRKYHQGELTFRMVYAFSENYVLSLSHDEVVHGKGALIDRMPGDDWQKIANLRLLYGYMYTQPGKKLLFMGQEFGQREEWSHERSLDWHLCERPEHQGLLTWVRDLNALYRREPSLHAVDCEPRGFEWIDYSDAEHSVVAFCRRGDAGEVTAVVANFTPTPRPGYRIGAPQAGTWAVIANSDRREYGGSGHSLPAEIVADAIPWHGREQSMCIDLPPLGIVVLKVVAS